MAGTMKPCPFCGGEGYITSGQRHESGPDSKWYAVACAGCAANGGWSKSESGAIERWNMRHAPKG